MEKFSQEWFENEFVEMLKLMEPQDPEDEECVGNLIAMLMPFLSGKYQLDTFEFAPHFVQFFNNTPEQFFYDAAKQAVR